MKMHTGYTALWLVLVVGLAVLELIALARPGYGDTLSEHVWKLRPRPWLRFILYPLLYWLAWHWPFGGARLDWRDALAAGVGLLVACLT